VHDKLSHGLRNPDRPAARRSRSSIIIKVTSWRFQSVVSFVKQSCITALVHEVEFRGIFDEKVIDGYQQLRVFAFQTLRESTKKTFKLKNEVLHPGAGCLWRNAFVTLEGTTIIQDVANTFVSSHIVAPFFNPQK
jgi:hypothetical protein